MLKPETGSKATRLDSKCKCKCYRSYRKNLTVKNKMIGFRNRKTKAVEPQVQESKEALAKGFNWQS